MTAIVSVSSSLPVLFTVLSEFNPYGTPTSLTVRSPPKLAAINYQPFSIPDSPPSRATSFNYESARRADDLDLRNTKSESPELTSVLGLPFDDIDDITERESGLKISASNRKIATPASLLQLKDQQALEGKPVESRAHLSATGLAVSDKVSTFAHASRLFLILVYDHFLLCYFFLSLLRGVLYLSASVPYGSIIG